MTITNGYCSLSELKARLQVEDEIDNNLLEDCINSASRTIDNYCHRTFTLTSLQPRYFEPPSGSSLKFGAFNDLVTLTTLKTDASGDGTFETTWAATEYQLLPTNQYGPETRPYTGVRALTRSWPYGSCSVTGKLVEVTGTWGWAAVPANIKEACLLQAQREAKQRYMPADASYLPWTVVKSLLDPYRLDAVLVA